MQGVNQGVLAGVRRGGEGGWEDEGLGFYDCYPHDLNPDKQKLMDGWRDDDVCAISD